MSSGNYPGERDELYLVACSDEYKDMNPHEVYNSLLIKEYILQAKALLPCSAREGALPSQEMKEGTSRKTDELTTAKPSLMWISLAKTDVKELLLCICH